MYAFQSRSDQNCAQQYKLGVTSILCILIDYFLYWKYPVHLMIKSAFLMDAPYLWFHITLNSTLKSSQLFHTNSWAIGEIFLIRHEVYVIPCLLLQTSRSSNFPQMILQSFSLGSSFLCCVSSKFH